MRIFAECYPCMLEQAERAARLSGLVGEGLHQAMRETETILRGLDVSLSPPAAAAYFYERIKELSGVEDPYRDLKAEGNAAVLALLPKLRRMAADSPDPLSFSLRAAVAGNIIDFGARSGPGDLAESLRRLLGEDLFLDHISLLRKDLEGASSALVICDNAGEIVLDLLLCEIVSRLYPHLNLTAAVRGGPIINDATLEDAAEVGLDRVCRVITTGLAMAGVDLERAGPEFREAFFSADVILAKGQGNFETLEGQEENIYLLFQVKCDCVARLLSAGKGAGLVCSLRAWNKPHMPRDGDNPGAFSPRARNKRSE